MQNELQRIDDDIAEQKRSKARNIEPPRYIRAGALVIGVVASVAGFVNPSTALWLVAAVALAVAVGAWVWRHHSKSTHDARIRDLEQRRESAEPAYAETE